MIKEKKTPTDTRDEFEGVYLGLNAQNEILKSSFLAAGGRFRPLQSFQHLVTSRLNQKRHHQSKNLFLNVAVLLSWTEPVCEPPSPSSDPPVARLLFVIGNHHLGSVELVSLLSRAELVFWLFCVQRLVFTELNSGSGR